MPDHEPMKPSLQLKLTQHLALTPQLQQSIRLLQLSTLELNQELEQILADNPLLERLDDPLDDCLRISANGTIEAAGPAPDERGRQSAGADDGGDGGGDNDVEGADQFEAGDRTGDAGDMPDYGTTGEWSSDAAGRTAEPDDDHAMPQVAASGRTLRDHLLTQLASTQATAQDCALVALLIDNLNDDGYLDADLERPVRDAPRGSRDRTRITRHRTAPAAELRPARSRRARPSRGPVAATRRDVRGRAGAIDARDVRARAIDRRRAVSRCWAPTTSPGSSEFTTATTMRCATRRS